MADDEDRSRLVALAWELAEQGWGVRYIAERIGRSPATAARYVKEGREAASWIEVLDRAEERARAAQRLDLYTSWLLAERSELGGKALEYVPVLLKVEERRAKLTGSDAPTRVKVEDDRPAPTVDPETVRAIRAAQDSQTRELSDLRAGPTTEGDPTS